MRDFLIKLKIIDFLTTELTIPQDEFVANFKRHVDEGDTGLFTDAFDMFSSSKNEYKGCVGRNDFKIKRRKKIFDTNMNMAVASGKFRHQNDTLLIETEINGFHRFMYLFYIMLTIFYSIFIVGFTLSKNTNEMPLFVLLFILFHATIMFGLPYFIMRRSTKRMKHDLEREFYYMTKK